jgi:hypothetical protein
MKMITMHCQTICRLLFVLALGMSSLPFPVSAQDDGVSTISINVGTGPSLTIITPISGLRVSNSILTVEGSAPLQGYAVTNVYYSLNSPTNFVPATTTDGWAAWSAEINLISGTNTISAYAVDSSGALSATNTVQFVAVLSTQITVQTNGRGTLSPNDKGAALVVGQKYSITATPATGFAFTNWTGPGSVILTNGRTLTFTMASNLVLTANFADVQKPVVTILSPTANQMVASNSFLIRGKASDNAAVASVWYQFNGGGWLNPVGVTNWSTAVTLNPGTNTVMACAVDTSGNVSLTNTVRFVYVDKASLIVLVSGRGTVTPNYNGALLQIGQNYSMTAKAAAGFAFTNWTALDRTVDIESILNSSGGSSSVTVTDFTSAGVLTNGLVLNFTMSNSTTGFARPGDYTVTNAGYEANFVDIAPPIVTITAPTSNLRVSNTVYTVAGKASDNVAVATVYYQLNGGGWQSASTANGWTNWFTPNLSLLSGTNNVVQACAVDTAGNMSATQTVNFLEIYQDPAPDSLNGTFANGYVIQNEEFTNGVAVFDNYLIQFGTNTFSGPIFGRTPGLSAFAFSNSVGVFAYLKISTNQGVLLLSNTAPPSAVGGETVLDLTFSSPSSATFYNESSGDNGIISFSATLNIVPETVAGKKLLLIDDDQGESSWSLGNGTVALTDFSGNRPSASYSFRRTVCHWRGSSRHKLCDLWFFQHRFRHLLFQFL